jgi:hypothetical protein
MFLVYADESGQSGDQLQAHQPVLVVGGVLVNSYNGARTRREMEDLLTQLAELAGHNIPELKGSDLFRGRGAWEGVNHATRRQARQQIGAWIAERQHKIVLSAIRVARFLEMRGAGQLPNIRARVFASIHLALQVQLKNSSHRAAEQRKNSTILIFDKSDNGEQNDIARLIAHPPEWALEVVQDAHRDGELSAILDTAYFVESTQASLVQLADFICYFIQRKAVLGEGLAESYVGETASIEETWEQLRPLVLPRSKRLPQRPTTPIRAALAEVHPAFLRND